MNEFANTARFGLGVRTVHNSQWIVMAFLPFAVFAPLTDDDSAADPDQGERQVSGVKLQKTGRSSEGLLENWHHFNLDSCSSIWTCFYRTEWPLLSL